MAKLFRASDSKENLEGLAACVVPDMAESCPDNPSNAADGLGRPQAMSSATKHHRADAIAIAILLGLVILAARNGATLWQVPHANQPPKGGAETVIPAGNPEAARQDELARQKAERQRILIAQLRTDVGNVLGGVEESRWSLATLKTAVPALNRFIAQAKAAGRSDLALYWRALAEQVQCSQAAVGGDIGLARIMLGRAAKHLRELEHGATQADSTLRGDVILTIGTFLGNAKVLGIEAGSPLVVELTKLRHRLKVEDMAARRMAPNTNQR